jgi:hypothetical protein
MSIGLFLNAKKVGMNAKKEKPIGKIGLNVK